LEPDRSIDLQISLVVAMLSPLQQFVAEPGNIFWISGLVHQLQHGVPHQILAAATDLAA
jgi:hypothetical protein